MFNVRTLRSVFDVAIWRHLAFVTACVVTATPAAAQLACGPRDQMIFEIEGRYGEHRIAGGLTRDDRIAELYVNDTTGTWSFILTDVNGTSCLYATGRDFDRVRPKKKGKPA